MVAVLLFVLLQLLVVLTTDGGHISDQSLFCRRTPRPNNLTTSNLQPDQNRREHRGDCPKLTAPAGCTEKGVPESILLHRVGLKQGRLDVARAKARILEVAAVSGAEGFLLPEPVTFHGPPWPPEFPRGPTAAPRHQYRL
eukprot:s1289_g14.t1